LSIFRYKKSGPNKRFRLGVAAPLPDDFAKVCADLDITLDQQVLQGGVFVDNETTTDGHIPDVDGHWMKQR